MNGVKRWFRKLFGHCDHPRYDTTNMVVEVAAKEQDLRVCLSCGSLFTEIISEKSEGK